MGKQRLELTWIGKNFRPTLEPRILIEDPEKSFGSSETVNMLIHGDNLLALKALEQDFSEKIKCIFIDPPYNTGNAFEHYDDGLEHSIWLSLIRDRIVLLNKLLATDGVLWVAIDDTESHYLKVLLDEIFGRDCFVANIIWEKADSPRNSARQFSTDHDHILVYSKSPDWQPYRLPRTEEANSIYTNPDNDPLGPWLPGDPYANKPYSKGLYTIKGPTGRDFSPPPGRYWRISEEKLHELDNQGRVWWGPNGNARPSIKRYLSEVGDLVPRTIWGKKDVGSNRTSKNEMRKLFPGEASFATPKPEALIQRVLHISTKEGDLVLDSFLGSGTTAAVAHKMNRKWIAIELGEHCYTLCKPRIDKIIAGNDEGGVTSDTNWKGGGGYKFYELAPSLLNKDTYGNWIINPEYNADMLAAAMAKQEGFKYNPDPDIYWKQGQSTEQDFIFTTTEFLTQEHVEFIHSQMKEGESLLICCKAFNANDTHFSNITIKKIPKMLMGKCEFGKDDYSLNIINIPKADNEEDFPDSDSEPKPKYIAGQAERIDLEEDSE